MCFSPIIRVDDRPSVMSFVFEAMNPPTVRRLVSTFSGCAGMIACSLPLRSQHCVSAR